jgi:hypothetical protein
MTAGGKRQGAGRKPLALDQRAVGVTMRVRPDIAARFAAWCTRTAPSDASPPRGNRPHVDSFLKPKKPTP